MSRTLAMSKSSARGRARTVRRFAATVAAGALVASSVGLTALPASANTTPVAALPANIVAANAPGNPGTPSEPKLIWEEDFEGDSAAAPIKLPDYQGTDGVRYTADPYWLSYGDCNGLIVSYAAGDPTDCNGTDGRSNVRRLADVLGQVQQGVEGSSDKNSPVDGSTDQSKANRAVAAFTQDGGAAVGDHVVFRTVGTPIGTNAPVSGSSTRFLTGAVDAAELSCAWSLGENEWGPSPDNPTNSKLSFVLVDAEGDEHPITTDTIQPCLEAASGGYYGSPPPPGSDVGSGGDYIAAGSYYAPAAVLLDPQEAGSLGLILRNDTLTGNGNDFAFDRVRLYDATPQLDKGFSPATVEVGSPSTLTFTITNTDDLGAKSGWGFTDTLPAGLTVADTPNITNSCPAVITAGAGAASITVANGELPQGATACTITVDVTAATAGNYTNGADNINAATGIDFPGNATVTVEPVEAPAIALTKTADLVNGDASVAGDVVLYSFTAENTGDVVLTDVEITDPLPGLPELTYENWPGAPNVLAPGESVTASATYELTQTDIDNGGVDNTATVTGNSPDGDPVEAEDTASVTVPAAAAISITKDGAITAQAEAGAEVVYTFEVENTGNVTLTDVTATDAKLDPNTITLTGWAGTEGSLAPGDVVTGTGTYILTAADIEAGTLFNTASTEGTPPNGPEVTDEDEHEIEIPSGAAIQLEKNAVRVATGAATPGETVTYTFTVTNIGNVPLTDVGIDDTLAGLSTIEFGTWPDAEGALAPGESVTATATLTVTQAHIDAGDVVNTAIATGTSRTGDVTDEDDATVLLPQAPQIALDKTGALTSGPNSSAGDLVGYTFEVTNTGNVTLTDVTITDELEGLSNVSFEGLDAGVLPVLAPGVSVTGSASYPLTQADVDRGTVTNLAEASGISPLDVVVIDSDDAVVEITAAAELTVTKSGSFADAESIGAGTSVTYEFTVTNTGDVTLSGVALTDELPGLSEIVYDEWPGDEGILAPGQLVTATAIYELTQADVDNGAVDNTVVATGFTPQDPNQEDPVTDDDTHTLIVPDGSAIQLVKTGSLDGEPVAGSTVNYTFEVSNIGTTTLTSVTVSDELAGLSDITFGDWPGADGVLAAGESVTASATLILTQAHIDSASVENEATATGTDPSGDDVTDTDDVVVVLPPAAAIELVKEAALADGAQGVVGDLVQYTFTTTNTGNVTLENVSIADRLAGLGEITYVWPGAVGVLAPGESATATAHYSVTEADVVRGSVENSATVVGLPPSGDPVTDVSTVTTELPDAPVIATPDPADPADPDLAQTGADLLVPGLVGLSLLILGAVLISLRRKPQNQDS